MWGHLGFKKLVVLWLLYDEVLITPMRSFHQSTSDIERPLSQLSPPKLLVSRSVGVKRRESNLLSSLVHFGVACEHIEFRERSNASVTFH